MLPSDRRTHKPLRRHTGGTDPGLPDHHRTIHPRHGATARRLNKHKRKRPRHNPRRQPRRSDRHRHRHQNLRRRPHHLQTLPHRQQQRRMDSHHRLTPFSSVSSLVLYLRIYNKYRYETIHFEFNNFPTAFLLLRNDT